PFDPYHSASRCLFMLRNASVSASGAQVMIKEGTYAMGLFSFLDFGGGTKQLRELSARIAPRCRAAVWNRVQDRVTTMRLSEARGYIRARSAAVVHSHVDAELAGSVAIAISRAELVALVTETVATLVFRD